MYWADKIAKEIISSGKYKSSLPLRGKPYWVDDMKTPSGFAHIGSLRGPITHSLIFRALKDADKEATYTFVINDFDPVDELSPELKDKFGKYLGFPLKRVPSPEAKFESLADYYADDFISTNRALGVEAKILSSWEMYREGKFDGVIKEALDNSEKIQDIYQKVSGSKKREKGWLPFQVICEKCGKLGTTRVYDWDDKAVSYKCEPNMVTWAKGCGHEGKVSPFGGTGKLPWKVDWAAHWKVIGVTIEGAGKDHASAGGSYDIAMALCKEVFNYPQPFKLPYEFLLIGGKKMSSSKSLGLKAHDMVKILPADLGRFLFSRWDYREQVEFNPAGTMAIADLFDEYDRCWQAYIDGSDEDLARIFVLAQVAKVPQKKTIFLPRFREVAQVLQMPNVNPKDYFKEKKGSDLKDEEKDILEERMKYAKVWLSEDAPSDAVFKIAGALPKEAKKLSGKQKKYLDGLADLIDKAKTPQALEEKMYELTKEIGLSTKDTFQAVYISLFGKPHGPKASWLIWENKDKAIKLFKEASK